MSFSSLKATIITSGIAILVSTSCHNIKDGKKLNNSTVKLIRSLGLLEQDEKIIKYYSNYVEKGAGNFFTNKRIAHYWLDRSDRSKNDTSFAFYHDIISIDTVYVVPDTFSPYMTIKKSDSTEFKVYVDGNHNEIKSFFEEAINIWQAKK